MRRSTVRGPWRQLELARNQSRVARICLVSVVVGLVVSGGPGLASARDDRAQVCGSSDGHTVIARDVRAIIYRTEELNLEFYGYWGCVYGSRKAFRLGRELVAGSPYGSLAVKNVTLVGATVAYETESSTTLGNREVISSMRNVVVANLAIGQTRHKVPTGTSRHPAPRVVGAGETRVIVVKRNGAVAWINDTVQKENRFEVHALDATGERVLAVGSNIAPESLALAGSTLYWSQGGKPFSAVLH
jgi:hypothetical protein